MSPIASHLPPRNGASGEIRLTLPVPPSANELYNVFRNRPVLKQLIREYRSHVAAWCLAERVQPILKGDITVTVDWYRTEKRADLDNLAKVLLDSLKRRVAFTDDKQVRRLVMERHEASECGRERACVEVRIYLYRGRE